MPTASRDDSRIAIAGGGMSGLDAVILDRGRAAGGRVAICRAGGQLFDHGVQHFTVRDARFGREAAAWTAEGAA
jgi:predicted NAD/FAD-dependent oxidoreductase